MSYTSEDWRLAITRLLEMTSKNELKWEPTNLYEGDAWTVVDRSLCAFVEDKAYVVSRTRSKHFLDETDFIWQGGFEFSIFQKKGFQSFEQIATAPALNAISALYDAAEGNLAFNRGALGGLLS